MFIGIKIRPSLREDGLLLFMEVFMTLQITGDAKEIAELIGMLQIRNDKIVKRDGDTEKYTYTYGDKPGSIGCISGSL